MKNFLLTTLIFLTPMVSLYAQPDIEIPKDKATVYILRPTVYAIINKVKIFCDDDYVGAMRGQNYMYTFVSPGKHIFTTKELQNASLEHTFEAGKVYYIKQRVQPGILFFRKSSFKLISKTEAEPLFKKCLLSKHQINKDGE